MKISIDTKEDSHEEIRKVIKMLQNLVGGVEVFTNQSSETSPIANIFGDSAQTETQSTEMQAIPATESTPAQATESTEDLFAELFSEEELKKMEPQKDDDAEELEVKSKSKSKRPELEFY